MIEIERKWIVELDETTPIGLFYRTNTQILQAYVDDVRYRWANLESTEVEKTIKTGEGMVRTEETTIVDSEEALRAVLEANDGFWMRKHRFKIRHGEYTIELDYFVENGLAYAEIEFPTVEEAEAFTDIPSWFGKEVTGDPAWNSHSIYLELLDERLG